MSGLTNYASKASALEYDAEGNPVGRIKALLDAEMDKCDLLCHNCHICRKPRGLARHEVYVRPAPPPARAKRKREAADEADVETKRGALRRDAMVESSDSESSDSEC